MNLGVVKVDTKKDFNIWNNINLSDMNTVRGLLKYRYKFDELYYSTIDDRLGNGIDSEYVDYANYSEDIRFLYIELDDIINNLISFKKINDRHMFLLKLYQDGESLEYIADKMNVTFQNVSVMLDNISKKITAENNWRYLKVKYLSIFKLKSKKCSRCGEELPITEEFFTPLELGKDGFFTYCRKCKQKNEAEKYEQKMKNKQ